MALNFDCETEQSQAMTDINFEQARFNMIEQQIRPWDVLDQRVLDLIARVPREDFVPAAYRNAAFTDMSIPLGRGQVMMAPKIEARLLQALDIRPDETVLEVGSGSGYLTALLANQARHVYSTDIIPEFKLKAAQALASHDITNVSLEVADAANGFDRHGPYDVIVVTGSLPMLTGHFKRSLNMGGRLFAIVGDSPVMEAMLITRIGENEWTEDDLFETDLVPLLNASQPQRFKF